MRLRIVHVMVIMCILGGKSLRTVRRASFPSLLAGIIKWRQDSSSRLVLLFQLFGGTSMHFTTTALLPVSVGIFHCQRRNGYSVHGINPSRSLVWKYRRHLPPPQFRSQVQTASPVRSLNSNEKQALYFADCSAVRLVWSTSR